MIYNALYKKLSIIITISNRIYKIISLASQGKNICYFQQIMEIDFIYWQYSIRLQYQVILTYQPQKQDNHMEMLSSFFKHVNPFTKIINQKLLSNEKLSDSLFTNALKSYPSQFIAFINTKEQTSLSSLQIVTLLHHTLIHSSQFYELFNGIILDFSIDDYWLNQNILVPYQNLIKKILHSTDLYEKIRIINLGWNKQTFQTQYQCKQIMRQNPQEYFNFQTMCYCINLLNKSFQFLRKVPNLGRYYRQQKLSQLSSFVYINSYQITILYFALKFLINQVLTNHYKYLKTDQQRSIFKDLLLNHLQKINDQVKNLLLNKYFNPISRGIRISIFDLDQQNFKNTLSLQQFGIACQNTTKNKDFKLLKKKVFEDGKLNKSIFEESMMVMMKMDEEQENDRENKNQILSNRLLYTQNMEEKTKQPNGKKGLNIDI